MNDIWMPQTTDQINERAQAGGSVPLAALVNAYLDVSLALLSAQGGVAPHPGEGAELAELALGAAIARRLTQGHGVGIRDALNAGASWSQVAAALDVREDAVKAEFEAWVDGQARLFAEYGKFGLNADDEAAARRHLQD